VSFLCCNRDEVTELRSYEGTMSGVELSEKIKIDVKMDSRVALLSTHPCVHSISTSLCVKPGNDRQAGIVDWISGTWVEIWCGQ
jgi:hypothetical protein